MTPPLSEVIRQSYLHTFITILSNNTTNIYILSTKIILAYNFIFCGIIFLLRFRRKIDFYALKTGKVRDFTHKEKCPIKKQDYLLQYTKKEYT